MPGWRELHVANHALGDRVALDAIWQERGYWFFRDVLDHDAIAVARRELIRELAAHDVVDAQAEQPLWNGQSLDDLPAKFPSLHERRVWQSFVASPRIAGFFEELAGDALCWIPMEYYRLIPPVRVAPKSRLLGAHQDGYYNVGMDFLAFWIPLHDIDADTGGIALAEGEHKRGGLHDPKLIRVLDEGIIHDESWVRSDYRAGDLLVIHPMLPHSGLNNISDRFRLSFDIRAIPRSGNLPIIGEVLAIDSDRAIVRDEIEGEVLLPFDDDTFLYALRPGNLNPGPVTRAEVSTFLLAGTPVMASRDANGRTLTFRPQS